VAYQVSDVLSDNAARRPMFGNVLDLASARTGAVKTGTTNDYKDSWTIGYTPSLVTGVWVGNTDNSAMLQVAGSLGAGYIWKEFMDTTLKDQPKETFTAPPGAVRVRTCGIVEVIFAGTSPGCSVGSGSYTVNAPAVATRPAGQPTVQPTPRPTPVLPPS
jgi:membrane carboxypeptidase/penicillin-binding protein